jgi:hypothetical protein
LVDWLVAIFFHVILHCTTKLWKSQGLWCWGESKVMFSCFCGVRGFCYGNGGKVTLQGYAKK